MATSAYKNELLKRSFYEWLKESRGFSDNTIECYEKAIYLWEDFTNKADLATFNKTLAGGFKEWLKNKNKINSQDKISMSYCYDNLRHLKVFFEWLSEQPNYKSKINKTAIAYLNLTKKEIQTARTTASVKNPTLETIKKTIENIKGKTEIEMRDKALLSLAFLTGARISAIRTLPMESLDRKELIITQDPTQGVETKFAKKIISVLIPFGYKESINYFTEWFDYLEQKKGFKPSDPIFPATKIENGKDNISFYSTGEVEAKFFKESGSLRKIFEKRFKQVGSEYYHPHTFRHSWVKEMAKLPLTEEEKKAISQNLGHANTATTFGAYGYNQMDKDRQIELMKSIDFEGRKREVKQYISMDDARQLLKEQEDNKNKST